MIDAPGVRDFAAARERLLATPRSAASSRCSASPLIAASRIAGTSGPSPRCAVRAAPRVAGGRIAARRYESYRRLFRLYQAREFAREPSGLIRL